jgi:N-acetylated-alpha-linked acidic dipeptidase
LGVAALDLRYGGEDDGGSYHSAYDSFDHYTKFGDPGFEYCHTAAQTSGRAVLRLAQADFLPFDFTPFANTVARYVAEVIKLPEDMRQEAKDRARLLKDRSFELTRDRREKLLPPPPLASAPFLDFAPLQNSLARLQENARLHASALQSLGGKESGLDRETRVALNEALVQTERLLTRDKGLPRRPWYKHQIYAPGYYTGYGVKTLPGVREAIEERNWKEATEQIVILAQTLDMFAEQVRAVTTLLGSRKPE